MARLLAIFSLVPALISAAALAPKDDSSLQTASKCRCFPGDRCWPTKADWNLFNTTLGGKLVSTVPIAASCHDSAFGPYDAQRCAELRSVWGYPETHIASSSSPMAPFFANLSCDPFTSRNAQCVVGTQMQYAVDATSAADYRAALAFARQRNIRLVIRNTGHDYFGKSTGAGALGIWTHHLKDIQVINYSGCNYKGKALKVGAGVQVFEAQAAAHAKGLVVVSGNCPTVGIAGGYTQGGGHGPLATKFGLSADQVLEWEVITSAGDHLVASPTKNSDLYWALSGGGGGTYAAVLSMTVRAHPDLPVSAANLTFTSKGVSSDTFYGVVDTFLTTLPSIVDAGAVSIFLLSEGLFVMQPTTAPGVSKAKLQTLLDPVLTKLKDSGMSYGMSFTNVGPATRLTCSIADFHIDQFSTYLDSYSAYNPPSNVTEFNIGGRLIPRALLMSQSSAAAVTDALRFIVTQGAVVSGVSVNVAKGAKVANSVNPAWRSSIMSAVIGMCVHHSALSLLLCPLY